MCLYRITHIFKVTHVLIQKGSAGTRLLFTMAGIEFFILGMGNKKL